jgi:hypothetical protein
MLLTPIFGDVPVPMFLEAGMPRVRQLWRPGLVGSKIHILTGCSNRPAIKRAGVSKVRTTANRRGLREREGTRHDDRGC